MKYALAALFVFYPVLGNALAVAKDTCTHTWGKGKYKTFKQVQGELHDLLLNGKILRLSLCGAENEHYFQVIILQRTGKVLVVRLPAR